MSCLTDPTKKQQGIDNKNFRQNLYWPLIKTFILKIIISDLSCVRKLSYQCQPCHFRFSYFQPSYFQLSHFQPSYFQLSRILPPKRL